MSDIRIKIKSTIGSSIFMQNLTFTLILRFVNIRS